uniref:Uncharacterized protein n=1 Tax=Aegilops tauschii subsp. strangulata TaxID=200361 RepID=A0A453DYE3_AEGTS
MSAPRRSSSGPRGRTQGQNVGSGSNSYISRSTDASQGHASSQPERSRRWPLARDDMLVPVTVKMLGDASVRTVDGNCPVINGYRPSTLIPPFPFPNYLLPR